MSHDSSNPQLACHIAMRISKGFVIPSVALSFPLVMQCMQMDCIVSLSVHVMQELFTIYCVQILQGSVQKINEILLQLQLGPG